MTIDDIVKTLDRFSVNSVRVSFRRSFTLPGGKIISFDVTDTDTDRIVEEIMDAMVNDAGYPLEIAKAAFNPEEGDPPTVKHLTGILANTTGKISVEDAQQMISDFTGTTFERYMIGGIPMRRLKAYIKEVTANKLREAGLRGKEIKEMTRKIMAEVNKAVASNRRPFSYIGVKSVKLTPEAKRGSWLFVDTDEYREELNGWISFHVSRMLREKEWNGGDKRIDVTTAIATICKKLNINTEDVIKIDDDGKVDFKETLIRIAEESET